MMNRLFSALALLLCTAPLTGCGGGDDDSAPNTEPKTSPWSGKTYFLEMADTQWYEPRGVGKEFGPFVPAFLVQISGTDAASLTATIGTAKLGSTAGTATQETCSPTTTVTFSGSGYPNATIASSAIKMFIPNDKADPPVQATANVEGWKMTNALPDGSTAAASGEFQAAMDFRQVYKLVTQLGDSRTPDSVCKEVDSQLTSTDCMDPSCHVTCQPCADGQAYCLTLKAEDATAIEVPGLTLTEVTTPAGTCADSTVP